MDKILIRLLYFLSVILIDFMLIQAGLVNENYKYSNVFTIPKKQQTDEITTTENLNDEISGGEGSQSSQFFFQDKKYLDSLGIYANLSPITSKYYNSEGRIRDELFKSLTEDFNSTLENIQLPEVELPKSTRTIRIVIPVGLITSCIGLCCKYIGGKSSEEEGLLSVETETVLNNDVDPPAIPMPAPSPKNEPVQSSEAPPPSYEEAVLDSTGAHYNV